MQAEAIPDTLWPRLSEIIAAKTGLHFPPERRQDLQRALSDAAADLGFANGARCADWLLSASLTGAQLHTLASHLTIGETYFFRERKTFDALVQSILPELIHRRRGREQRLRFWSAACSTGEEPYSLAILLDGLIPDWEAWRITILATDINSRFLQKAVAGVYGEWSFRETPATIRDRYFTRTADRRFALAPHIRERVTFTQLNLSQDGFPSLTTDTNAMDVILCRNVLIYFTPTHARRLVANLRHALVDEGWLAVSPSEWSQALFPGFVSVNFPEAILYRKGQAREQAPPAWSPAAVAMIEERPAFAWGQVGPPTPAVSSAPPAVPRHTELEALPGTPSAEPPEPLALAEALYRQGRYADAANALMMSFGQAAQAHPAPLTAHSAQTFSLLARALANQGSLAEALAWSARWIAADKLNASAHYLHAMVSQELGDSVSARRSLQRAVYLQPDLALAHFALGNCARAAARGAEAGKHFQNALRLLRSRPPDELVPESEGLTAGRLTEIISALSTEGNLSR